MGVAARHALLPEAYATADGATVGPGALRGVGAPQVWMNIVSIVLVTITGLLLVPLVLGS